MKSTDNGDNWEFIEVYQTPFYPPPGGATVDFGAGDGTQALAIAPDNSVHVVFGRMVCAYSATGALGLYLDSEGVIYWHEGMPILDSTIVSSYTLDYLAAGGNLAGQLVEPGISGILDIPVYWSSLTSHPQILIDDNNRIFTLWSGAAPGYANGTKNYKHIYGNSSNDGGLTWNGIVDMTDALIYTYSECVFPAIAPTLVNNEFHFIFQNDGQPGIFVWATSQVDPTDNNITHMSRDASFLTGIRDNQDQASNRLIVSQNFPNPFKSETYIDVSVGDHNEVTFLVSDFTGKIVFSESYRKISKDKFRIHFVNNNLYTGVYYYTILSDSGTFTGKMVVK